MDRFTLVCTQDDMVNLKKQCRKWILLIIAQEKGLILYENFLNLQTLHFFSLLKDIPKAYKDAVIPESFFENHNVNCCISHRNTKQPHNVNF